MLCPPKGSRIHLPLQDVGEDAVGIEGRSGQGGMDGDIVGELPEGDERHAFDQVGVHALLQVATVAKWRWAIAERSRLCSLASLS